MAEQRARDPELRRLEPLYEISKLLTAFEGVEETVAKVIAVVARTLPLRSAVLIFEGRILPRTLVWQAQGEGEAALRLAKAHAEQAYAYFVARAVDRQREEAGTLELPRLPATATEATTAAMRDVVVLPIVVDQGSIFGALQIEGAGKLEELDLYFINAVVNQLAIAVDRNSVERALRASEERLAGIISLAEDAIISVDEAQRIVMYNEGAERIFGWSRDEALGKPLDMLLPERVRQIHRQHLSGFADRAETGRDMGAQRPPIFGLRKNGEEFPADAAISKLDVGGSWLFTVMLRDITVQKRVEQEERFLSQLGAVLATTLDDRQMLAHLAQLTLRELADFCVIDSVDGHGLPGRQEVATSDPAKAEVAEALKHLPLDPRRPHLSSAVLQSKQSQLVAEVSPETIRSIAQSEEHRRLLEALAPTSIMGVPLVIHGQLLGALVVASCRPERRYGASDLRLLEKVGRRASLALENARLYAASQRAVQTRDDVLGIVAHDLRNPLGTILLQAGLLRRRGGESERRSGVPGQLIERAATRMKRLILDLLDVTHLEADRLSIEHAPVHAGQVLLESLEARKQLGALGSIDYRLDVAPGLPEIWADRDRLLQVFENLIDNAAKFTAPGGRITVGARPGEGEVLFWVADTGTGISADELPHLFERFWQARKADRRGAGLGLPIVKGLVEAHGGRIWIESALGRGTTVFFTVPTAPSVAERPGEASAPQ
ncbi:MAG: sensor histidine kinase [Myxococcaceae bacterium]